MRKERRDRTKRKERTKAVRKKLCKRLDLLIDARGVKNVDIVRHFQLHHEFTLDPGTITHWRAGNSWPGIDVFDLLCDYLKVRPGWFWTSEPVPEISYGAQDLEGQTYIEGVECHV